VSVGNRFYQALLQHGTSVPSQELLIPSLVQQSQPKVEPYRKAVLRKPIWGIEFACNQWEAPSRSEGSSLRGGGWVYGLGYHSSLQGY
jgi:hypothetical protein